MIPQPTKTCKKGHAMGTENTIHRHDGFKGCRACQSAANRRYRRRNAKVRVVDGEIAAVPLREAWGEEKPIRLRSGTFSNAMEMVKRLPPTCAVELRFPIGVTIRLHTIECAARRAGIRVGSRIESDRAYIWLLKRQAA